MVKFRTAESNLSFFSVSAFPCLTVMTRKQHWEAAYQTDGPTDVSWFQVRPDTSLDLIAATNVPRDVGIIDAGGGASTLVDFLLDAGYSRLAVLDLSAAALAHAHSRLGDRAAAVEWFEGD